MICKNEKRLCCAVFTSYIFACGKKIYLMRIFFYKSLIFLLVFIFLLRISSAQNSNGRISGTVTSESDEPISNVNIVIMEMNKGAVTNENGNFTIKNVQPGKHVIKASSLGYIAQSKEISVNANETANVSFRLTATATTLSEVTVQAPRDINNMQKLPDVQGAMIYAGEKNDIVVLQKTNGNIATNNPRQMFAKVPGIHIWELDGNGLQLNIASRGLNPHRSFEFIIQQNGYHVNSDLYGYPESHYNPPLLGVDHMEVIRGSAALQYGPQFGGVVNLVMKQGNPNKKIAFETNETVGSNYLFGSYNAIGGQVGKLNYYGYIDFRRSDGYRKNSGYDYWAYYANLNYQFTPKLNIGAEFSRMYYVVQLAGGLDDEQFNADPRQSTRGRNYFQPVINLPVLKLDYKVNDHSHFNAKAWGILGERNSVQFLANPNVADTVNVTLGSYNPRQVDRDTYKGFNFEARYGITYPLLKQHSTLSAGFKFFDEYTKRQQKGIGTTGSDFDLTLLNPKYGNDLNYYAVDYAFFAENLFAVTSKLSVTPSVRFEMLTTKYDGYYGSLDFNLTNTDNTRTIPLFGAGIQYKITPDISAYGNFSQAYRPVLYSDLTPSASTAVVDPNIKDADGYNSDIGIRGRIKDIFIFDVNAFYLYYDNRIGNLTLLSDSGTTYIYKTNVGTSASAGFESFAELHPLHFSQQSMKSDVAIFVTAAFDHATYVKGDITVNGSNTDITGNKLEAAPEWIIHSGITYAYQNLSATFEYSYVSDSYSDANNTEFNLTGATGVVPGYSIMDISLNYDFLSNYSLRAGINNLANAEYFTRRSEIYPGPGILPSDGRTFFISLGGKF
jgi:Fe(3+) dicitrate transport protein